MILILRPHYTLKRYTLDAPLTTSLVLLKGTGSFTFARTSSDTIVDFEGVIKTIKSGASSIDGARYVENYIRYSQDLTNATYWIHYLGAVATTFELVTISLFNGSFRQNVTATGIPDGRIYRIRFRAKAGTLNSIRVNPVATGAGGNSAFVSISNIPVTYTEYSLIYDCSAFSGGTFVRLIFQPGQPSGASTGTLYITNVQVEDITGQTNQNPSAYIPSDVLSSPWGGAGVDGVKYFNTLNGNTVSSNVVTEVIGAEISASTIKGIGIEASRTNLFLNSLVGVTQNITVTAQVYTISFYGTGTITLSGTSTGSLVGTGASNLVQLTFTPTAGTLGCAVSGSCTNVQVEQGAFASSRIVTAGAGLTRNAETNYIQTASNINSSKGTLSFDFTPSHAPSGTIYLWGSYVDASNSTSIFHDGNNLIFRKRIAGVNYDAYKAFAFTANTTYIIKAIWNTSGGTNITVDGVAGIGNSNTAALQLGTNMYIGSDGQEANQAFASFKNYTISPNTVDLLSDAYKSIMVDELGNILVDESGNQLVA